MGNGLEGFLMSIAHITDTVISRLENQRGMRQHNLRGVWWSTDHMMLKLECPDSPNIVRASLTYATDVYHGK